ncbi:unnamed protein product [Urochloa decumbens]|uniref:Uncharacterized protein n=1 Tax=Urochloa decumbens TaxID=240449 RepID=A0ABC9H349_9POAL
MALPTRRAGVLLQLLVVVLALAAAFISCAAAARAPEILQEVEAAAPADQGQAPAGNDAMSVEHVAVVDKRGGFFGSGHHGHHGHHDSSGHHRHRHNSAPGGRDGAWKAAGLAATAAAAAWLL